MATKKPFVVNQASLTTLRADMNAALGAVAKKHGVTIAVGGCKFSTDTSSADFKLAVVATPSVDEDGKKVNVVVAKAKQAWEVNALDYGLKNVWLGKTVVSNGRKLTIAGLMPSRRRYPILAVDAAGQQILLTIEGVKKFFANKRG